MQATAVNMQAADEIDRIPRYAPSTVLICRNGKAHVLPVLRYIIYPPNTHPDASPIIKSCTALECFTEAGSRWYGFERAWINSELRMVVSGFNARDAVRSKWEMCSHTT